MEITIITPCHNEENNIQLFHNSLSSFIDMYKDIDWRWLIIDDHSDNKTKDILENLAIKDPKVSIIRLSKNVGSHMSSLCGLQNVNSDAAIIMALDMQDEPDNISKLVDRWKLGAKIVWAIRDNKYKRAGFLNNILSKVYHRIMSYIYGKSVFNNGADFFLVDKDVINTVKTIRESRINILDTIHWLGFESDEVLYEKKTRVHGKSSWTFTKKASVFSMSIISNSAAPLRVFGLAGVITAIGGFIYAALIIKAYYIGHPYPGYSSLMVALLVIGGLILINLSIVGEYLWKVLNDSRTRPNYIIEKRINVKD